MSDKEQPLNGQQVQALQKQMAEQFAGAIKDVELRKWSVDQACGLIGAAFEADGGMVDIPDVVKIARSIHGFLTEQISDTFKPNQV